MASVSFQIKLSDLILPSGEMNVYISQLSHLLNACFSLSALVTEEVVVVHETKRLCAKTPPRNCCNYEQKGTEVRNCSAISIIH